MRSIATIALSLLATSADGFSLTPVVHTRTRATNTEMVLGYKLAAGAAVGGLTAGVVVATRKVKAAQSAAEAEKGRNILSGMSDLADLADLKLEREERVGRTAGVWKEYIKADGRVWYYNTDSGKQTWIQPEEFAKLDAVKEAAAAANAGRGTSLG